MSKTNDMIALSDLPLLAVLALKGFNPVSVLPHLEEPRRWDFSYPPLPEIEFLIKQYWDRALTVEPQAFALQLKLLKGRLYDAQARRGT